MQYAQQPVVERISIPNEDFNNVFNLQPKGVEFYLNTIRPSATGKFLLLDELYDLAIEINVLNGKLHHLRDAAIKYFEDGTGDLRFCIDGEEYFNQVTDYMGNIEHFDKSCIILENYVVLDEYQGLYDMKWYKILKENEVQLLPYFKQFIFETKAEQLTFKDFFEKVKILYEKGNPLNKINQFLGVKQQTYLNIIEASIDLASHIAKFITESEENVFERYETISQMMLS